MSDPVRILGRAQSQNALGFALGIGQVPDRSARLACGVRSHGLQTIEFPIGVVESGRTIWWVLEWPQRIGAKIGNPHLGLGHWVGELQLVLHSDGDDQIWASNWTEWRYRDMTALSEQEHQRLVKEWTAFERLRTEAGC